MRIAGSLALGLLVSSPSFAQDDPPVEPIGARHQIAPDNNWSIDESDCLIDASWDGDIGIVVNRHLDHHDLGIYDPGLRNVAPEKVIKVRYGALGKPAGQGEYEALGHNDGKLKSYVIEADAGLLDAFAATTSFQFYRGKMLEIELDMAGFSDALSAMYACEAKLPGDTMVADPDGDSAMESVDDGMDGSSQAAAAAVEAAAEIAKASRKSREKP